MKALDFIRNVPAPGAIYLKGDDGYLKDAVISEIIGMVPEYAREFNVRTVYGFKSPTELTDAIAAVSPFGGTEVVLAGGYQKKEKDAGKQPKKDTAKSPKSDKDLEEFKSLTSIAAGALYFVVYDSTLTASQAKLFTEVDCSRLDPVALRELIPSVAKPDKLDYRAINMLIEYCNRDMGRISVELKKLSAYAEGATITAEMVDLLVPDMLENEVYDLTNAFAEKNKRRAVELLDRFTSRGMAYAYLLALLIGQYRRLLHCALSQRSDAELASIMGVKEYAVKKNRELASKYGKTALKKIFDFLVKAETDFKQGVMSEETAVKTAFAKLLTV